jgi:thiamine-phosphate diphosphorylase
VTICLVTDRRRFDPPIEGLLAVVRRAIGAGVDLVQVRERDLEAAALADLVASILAAARGTPARVVVNDRLDVALACGADGVHLRADSIAVADARRIAPPGFLVGRSVHSIAEAQSARDADYLIAGAVYPTPSKPPSTAWLGVDGLRAIVRAVSVPVLAIGGITPENSADVAAAGAAGVAAIGLFERAAPGDAIAAMRRVFDTVKRGP